MEDMHVVHSAPDKVIRIIQKWIVEKKYYAGSRLPTENEMCELTGVSRSGVREAMKILESNHIIEIRRGDGTYLRAPDEITFSNPLIFKMLMRDTTFEELCAFRESIELAVMRLAVWNCDDTDIQKLTEINARMLMIAEDEGDEYDALYLADMEFHQALGRAGKNSAMRDVYQMTLELFGPLILRNYRIGQNGMSGYLSHVSVIEALKSKDFIQMIYAIKQSVDLWHTWGVRADAPVLLEEELIDMD